MNKKIIIVDDHEFIVEGWKSILANNPDIEIIYSFSNGTDFLEYLEKAEFLPDLFVIDYQLPDVDGFVLVEKIRSISENQKIIVSTFHEDLRYVKKAIKLGVQGYLMKDEEEANIHKCINEVLNNKKYYPAKIKQKIIFDFGEKSDDLTPKEIVIVKLIAKGLNNKEMADKENISIRTIESHRYNIMKKMDANNVADLIRLAMKKGYLE